MDRLQVEGVDSTEGIDISEFHFSSTNTNALTEEVGSFINYDDDGPTLTINTAPTVGAAEVVEASGVGGQARQPSRRRPSRRARSTASRRM